MSLIDAVTQSVQTNSIVTFDVSMDSDIAPTEGDDSLDSDDITTILFTRGCTECDHDNDTVWGIDADGSEFRIRPINMDPPGMYL